MPYRRTHFEKNQPVHIVSHAVAGTRIFENDSDCCRFIFQMYAANLGKPAPNTSRRNLKIAVKRLFQGKKLSKLYIKKEHKPLVHILDFSLVKNHYHLYLLPNITNGVIPFMQRLNLGFAKYFNLKHDRQGALFAGPYKTRLVEGETHSDTVHRYVSVINPLDIFQPDWREYGLRRPEEALVFLKEYKFSSFLDNIDQRSSRLLAPNKIREKYNLDHGGIFLDTIKYFLKERATRSYLAFSLE